MSPRRREGTQRRHRFEWNFRATQLAARCPAPWEPIEDDEMRDFIEAIAEEQPDQLRGAPFCSIPRPAWEVMIHAGIASGDEIRAYVAHERAACEEMIGSGAMTHYEIRKRRKLYPPQDWVRAFYADYLAELNAWADSQGIEP